MHKLNELNLIEAIQGLKLRKFTSVELVQACFEQIQKHDTKINAFISTRKDDALKEAEAADKLIDSEGSAIFRKKPLLGVPYALKDNFSTEGIQTTAGSAILKDYIPPFSATVVERLKDAGAIILGKTNMDAFAHGSSTETSDYGVTKNPWDITRIPGGSSGGSSAATAAHMCTFSIGSETAGSIRGPAGWCGITGLKPTYGRVSRYGVVAMASSTDSPGPLSKTVEDAALLLEIIAGKDQNDATTSLETTEKYFSNLNPDSLKGLKIGKPKSYFDLDLEPGVRKSLDEALEKLQDLGAEIIDIDLIPPHYSIGVYTILQRSEVSSNLARFDGIRFGHPRTSFGHEAKKRMMLGAYTLSAGYYDAYYAKAQKVRTLIVDDFKKAFEKVDLIVGPTMPNVAPELGISSKSVAFGEIVDLLQEPSAIAGLCGISFPCSPSEGLPVGMQFIGNFLDEQKILNAALTFQKATEHHTKFPNMEAK